MTITNSKVYIQTDMQGRILRCEGGYTTPADLSGWTYIDEGTGDRYNLCQSHYFDGGLFTDDGIPLYKLQDGKVLERTPEEMEADRAPLRAAEARKKRDKLLAETDWTQTLDAPVSAESKAALRAYRQELRDLPEKDNWPECVWPELPEIVKAVPENILYTLTSIIQKNSGTEEDPIQAFRGMNYIYGKYYKDPEDNKTYFCTRTGETEGNFVTLYYLPHELIGEYFKSV